MICGDRRACYPPDRMARGNHAPSGRAFPWVIVSLLAAAVVGGAAFTLLRVAGDGNATEPTPEFSFRVGGVSVTSVADVRPGEVDNRTVRQARRTLDRLYTIGFVDPAEWSDGTFPALPGLFGGPAANRVGRDLDDLTLGGSAAGVERVEPTAGRLRLSFLLDADEQPLSAIAQATFRARGTATDGSELAISHGGRYVLELAEGRWVIVAYQVEGELAAHAPSPGPAGTTGDGS